MGNFDGTPWVELAFLLVASFAFSVCFSYLKSLLSIATHGSLSTLKILSLVSCSSYFSYPSVSVHGLRFDSIGSNTFCL